MPLSELYPLAKTSFATRATAGSDGPTESRNGRFYRQNINIPANPPLVAAHSVRFGRLACFVSTAAAGYPVFRFPKHHIPTIQPMALSIKPLADRVVVKAAAAEATTKSGIIIPDTAKEKPQRGKVVAVGAGKTADNGTTIKPEVSVGDQVLYGKWTGTEITLDGEDYLIMQEKDILAVL
jgi:chaperonin GroES